MDFSIQVERLQQLEEQIPQALVAAFQTDKYEAVDALAEEYRSIKSAIKQAFLDQSTVHLPEDSSRHTRLIVQKVVLGEPLDLEERLAGTALSDWLSDELSTGELDKLADEHFHPWFSHFEYVSGMLEAGALVARVDATPPEFESFLRELRQCYAFQQYLAVCVLCRTSIEIALRHLVTLEGFFNPDQPEYGVMRAHYERKARMEGRDFRIPEDYQMQPSDTRDLLNTVPAFRRLNQPVRDLYSDLSRIVHGNKVPSKRETREYLTSTLRLLHQLYEL